VIFSLNKVSKTISHHKENCREVDLFLKRQGLTLSDFKSKTQGVKVGKQLWVDETHFNKRLADWFFEGKDYGKVYCSKCF